MGLLEMLALTPIVMLGVVIPMGIIWVPWAWFTRWAYFSLIDPESCAT